MVACILVAAVLAFFVFDHVMIISTAILGSFFFVRGIAVYAGHWYNMFTIIDLLKSGLVDQVDPVFWAYIGGFAVCTAVGCFVQFK